MEIGQLYQGLTFLAYATGIMIILVSVMLVKVLFELSKLTNNINDTTNIIKEELVPTLKNVNKTVAKGFFGGLCAGLKTFIKKK